MRILALVTDAFGASGGIAQYNRDLITALVGAKKVESIYVLPRLAPGPMENPPAKVTQTQPIFSRSLYAIKAIAEAFRIRPDLIFCGHLYMAPLARHLATLIGAPFVVQVHGIEIGRKPSVAQARALEQADRVFCVSRHTRAQVLKYTRANPHKVVVIPNTAAADYCPGDRATARLALGLKDEFVLLTVGRLDVREGYKGHDLVIDALAGLPRDARSIIYLISGDGDDRPRLEALAARRGVAYMVRFIGFRPREELPHLYRAADLFVMPSTGEGFGIVFLEAMASGTPALGLAVGGATDPLAFGEWGNAVTEAEFASALAQSISSPRPDSVKMHKAVTSRFGFDAFSSQIRGQLVERFSATAS